MSPVPDHPQMQAPAARPCGACPYRLDAPSGLWTADEYARLAPFDGGDPGDPAALGVFMCHAHEEQVCAGWAGVYAGRAGTPTELLGPRIGLIAGFMSREVFDAVTSYSTPAPLHSSGIEAATQGMRDVADPGPEARAAGRKLAPLFDEQGRRRRSR